MQFDRRTIVLLVRPPDAPELSGQELEAVQDTRLASQADLRTQGYLVAAGPVRRPGRRAAARFGVVRLRQATHSRSQSGPCGRPGRAAIGHGSRAAARRPAIRRWPQRSLTDPNEHGGRDMRDGQGRASWRPHGDPLPGRSPAPPRLPSGYRTVELVTPEQRTDLAPAARSCQPLSRRSAAESLYHQSGDLSQTPLALAAVAVSSCSSSVHSSSAGWRFGTSEVMCGVSVMAGR